MVPQFPYRIPASRWVMRKCACEPSSVRRTFVVDSPIELFDHSDISLGVARLRAPTGSPPIEGEANARVSMRVSFEATARPLRVLSRYFILFITAAIHSDASCSRSNIQSGCGHARPCLSIRLGSPSSQSASPSAGGTNQCAAVRIFAHAHPSHRRPHEPFSAT